MSAPLQAPPRGFSWPASAALLVLALALLAPCAAAQTISGATFEDRNGNGIQDAGEPALEGVTVDLFGTRDTGGATHPSLTTPASGVFSFSPGNGCYLLFPHDPPGWRFTNPRSDDFPKTTPGYTFPVGQPRFGKLDQAITHLSAGPFQYISMGDSIAWNWNSCLYTSSFWYSAQVQSRIACASPSFPITLDQAAVKGQYTDDLLVDDTADHNNVFRAIEAQPQLVTISMVGNDLLDVEPSASPTQAEINKMVAELLDARQNLQEALSSLVSEVPGADISLNTLYDNLAYSCLSRQTSAIHLKWIPILDRILRDLAWGQARRVSVNEVAADFAHENQALACQGFDGMICRDIFQTDNIHPTNNGYKIVREKVWEADGGVSLGSKDALSRTSVQGADYGFLRRVRRLLPTTWETRGSASVSSPQAAFDDADGGQGAWITLGAGSEEFRLSGFPDWYDEIQIVRLIAGVRYRTSGTVGDDFYRMEASLTGQFRPPVGHAYTPADWNFFTPIVGGGGPSQPAENPDFPNIRTLAVPNVAAAREVTATLTKNPVLDPGAVDYRWPAVTHEELATTAIRVASSPAAGTPGNDLYQVGLDAAWLDLYGWEKNRPAEVQGLRVAKGAGGALEVTFAPLAGAQRYNLYTGRLATLRTGLYDHGRGAPVAPLCAASTLDGGAGRLKLAVAPAQQPAGASYFLVTAHVDDVESPSGTRSGGAEIDRSQSVCR